jgi:hypothetical protein
MVRARLVRLIPLSARWFEVSSTTTACCGLCPPCITATAGAFLLPLVIREHEDTADAA